VFAVGDRLIALANYFAERASDPSLPLSERQLASNNAARFFNASADVMVAMSGAGGAATGYQVPSVAIQVSQYVDERGNPTEPPPPIKTLEDAERIIAEHESKRPVIAWERDDPDATPAPEDHESEQAPVAFMREENPDLVIDEAARIPSRASETPTAGGSFGVPIEGL
jgi:hypothetical protein